MTLEPAVIHLDPAVGTNNLGDEIISRAVAREIATVAPVSHPIRLPTQVPLKMSTYRSMRGSRLIFIGGSNLLDPRVPLAGNWKVNPAMFAGLSDQVCLIGVGLSSHARAGSLGRFTYRHLLSRTLLHSVRDSSAATVLRRWGLTNVANTACPTMWSLTPDHCRTIPTERSAGVVTTVTGAHPRTSVAANRALFDLLGRHYETIHFWPQGRVDVQALTSMGLAGEVRVLPRSLGAFDDILAEGVDYVGTRLHGGIHALSRGCRALILGVDHRAKTIHGDTGLPVTEYGDLEAVDRWISDQSESTITLPIDAIERWRRQFGSGG